MTPLEAMTSKDLIHLFVDGEVNDVQRTMLFRELADNAELQEYLSGVMRTEQTMEQYRATATVPDALRTAIFAQAGFGANIPATAPALAGIFWRYGIAVSVGAAILTGGISFNSVPQNTSGTQAIIRNINDIHSSPTVADEAKHPSGFLASPVVAETTIPADGNMSQKEEQYLEAITPISQQTENSIAEPSVPVETANGLALPQYSSDISLGGSARPENPAARFGRPSATIIDASVLVGGFGGSASPGTPTRLAAMYVFNHEVSVGAQYTTRSYNFTAANNGSVEVNPTVSGLEGIFQYTENSNILPLDMKPVFSVALGGNRLGATAFTFMGVAAEPISILTLQAGVEGNLLLYNSNGSHSVAGGGRFTINAGIRF
jgi:hypothetical protein